MSEVCTLVHQDPDIFQVAVPDPRYGSGATNCYIVREGDETLVVDVGAASEEGERVLRAALREVGARPEATSFFLTHLHVDHSGLLPAVALEGASVFLGAGEEAAMRALRDADVVEECGRRLQEGGVSRDEAEEYLAFRLGIDDLQDDRWRLRAVEGGARVRVGDAEFEVLDTAGHAPGHCSLIHRETGVLIGGDQVLFTTSPYVPLYPGVDDRLALYLDRLRAVRGEGVVRLLQAHGRLQDEKGAFDGRVAWLLEHRERRLREYRETIERTPGLTGLEVTLASPSSANLGNWGDYGMIQRWCIVSNGMAVLDHLACTGRVEARTEKDGRARYWPARPACSSAESVSPVR